VSTQNYPKEIHVHCSATPDRGDLIGVFQIEEMHRRRGFRDAASGISCGYHTIVTRSGKIEHGRPITSQPASILGFNRDAYAICLVGTRHFTDAQIEAALNDIAEKAIAYNIPLPKIKGHQEYPYVVKDCPNIPGSVLRKLVKYKLEEKINTAPIRVIEPHLVQNLARPIVSVKNIQLRSSGIGNKILEFLKNLFRS